MADIAAGLTLPSAATASPIVAEMGRGLAALSALVADLPDARGNGR